MWACSHANGLWKRMEDIVVCVVCFSMICVGERKRNWALGRGDAQTTSPHHACLVVCTVCVSCCLSLSRQSCSLPITWWLLLLAADMLVM